MEPSKRTANIRDVAKLAGVSHMTVSRVLNGHPNISALTRERVERSMDQLSFRPNAIARALATSRSGTIGVVCTDSGRYGPPKTLRAIESAARDAGYFISTINLAIVDRRTMRSALNHLTDQAVEAIVVIAPQSAMLDALSSIELSIPYVTVEPTGREGEHAFAIDQAAGAKAATQHLIDLGHREILHVSGPADWLDSQARVRGWRSRMNSAGLRYREPIVGDWSIEFGYETAQRIAKNLDFTAIFASNDHMALGLLRGFADAGIRVPQDVSVVGFDDIPESAYLTPPLTTIRPDYSALGRRCIGRLVDGLAGEHMSDDHLLVPELVTRASTSRPHPTLTYSRPLGNTD